MNNILKAAATVAISLSALGASVQAEEGQINGYVVDAHDSGSYSTPDVIKVYGPEGPEVIVVTCAPYSWTSNGWNSQSFVESIAQGWCF